MAVAPRGGSDAHRASHGNGSRRHRHRGRARRHRGGARGRPPGVCGGALHAVAGDGGADALQPCRRGHRQGPPRARDRRPRRPDGRGHRRHRDPVQAAEPQPRTGRAVAAGAGGQAPVRRVDAVETRTGARHRLDRRPGRRRRGRGRAGGRRRARRRRPFRLPRRGRDHGDVPERVDPRRPGAALGRSGRRAGVPGPGRVVEAPGSGVGAAEDGNAAPARPRQHRLRPLRGRAGRPPPGAVLVPERGHRPSPGLLSHRPHDARGARAGPAGTASSRRSTTDGSRASGPGTVRRSKTR